MTEKTFEQRTRQVFHDLHQKQGANKAIFERLVSLLDPAYLRVEDDFFTGKICLDAGCGSNANATFSMLQQGAEQVYCFDLDETIFETVPKFLSPFTGRYVLSTGTVLQLSFQDDFFDFVHCSGVLHHSADVFAGLRELARVTRAGGTLYVMTYGKGGVVRDIVSFFRERYACDASFQQFIDQLDQSFFAEFFRAICTSMQQHGDNLAAVFSPERVNMLFDDDLVLTIKDRITAPVYFEHDFEELSVALKKLGFSTVERLSRYPRYKNVRRFLSPLYDNYDSTFARLLYGSGSIQLKAVKDR